MSTASTNAYAAKRAIIDALTARAALKQGGLGQAKVTYAWDGGTGGDLVQVFGGLVYFTQAGDDDAVDGDQRLVKEEALISIHTRVSINPIPPDGEPAREADELVEAILDDIADEVARNRHLAGGHSICRIADGNGGPEPGDGETVASASIHIAIESYVH